MRRIAWGLLVVALLAPARAEACHTGYQIARAVFGLGALAVDTPLVIYDLAVDRASRGYGVLEAVLTAPQIALALSLRAEANEECGDASGTVGDQAGGTKVPTLMLVASGALFVHAIYVIVRPSAPAKPASPPTVGIVPVLVTDGESIPGVTMSLAF